MSAPVVRVPFPSGVGLVLVKAYLIIALCIVWGVLAYKLWRRIR